MLEEIVEDNQIEDIDYENIKNILKDMKNNKESLPFKTPVDHKKLGIYDYPLIIKEPMDFSTIEKKLQNNEYLSVIDVLSDFQKIWDNCKLYNEEYSDIYKDACKLELKNKQLINRFYPDIKTYGDNNHAALELKKQTQFNNYDDLSFKDKKLLTDKLKDLNESLLGEAITLIKLNSPKAFIEKKDIDSEILIDYIDKNTFNLLINFINSCN